VDREELIEEVDREAPIPCFGASADLGALMGQRLSACFGVADRADQRGTRELLPLRKSSLERQQQLRLNGNTNATPTLRYAPGQLWEKRELCSS